MLECEVPPLNFADSRVRDDPSFALQWQRKYLYHRIRQAALNVLYLILPAMNSSEEENKSTLSPQPVSTDILSSISYSEAEKQTLSRRMTAYLSKLGVESHG